MQQYVQHQEFHLRMNPHHWFEYRCEVCLKHDGREKLLRRCSVLLCGCVVEVTVV